MPWLGFSWQTKTVLFSLTGVVLLIIGNRQYNNEKKKQKIHSPHHHAPSTIPEHIPEAQPSIKVDATPTYFATTERETTPAVFSAPSVDTFDASSMSKPRVRRKVEMAPRARRISVRPAHLENDHTDSRVSLEDLS